MRDPLNFDLGSPLNGYAVAVAREYVALMEKQFSHAYSDASRKAAERFKIWNRYYDKSPCNGSSRMMTRPKS
jgi:hypothetical protein